MSKIEVDTIDTVTGTTELTVGGTNATDVTLGSGVKITNLESTGIDDNATSTAITINSSQNVGIGETNPDDALLVIKGDSDDNTTPSIRLKDGTDTREAWITNNAGDLYLTTGGNDNVPHTQLRMLNGNLMTFRTADTERMRIASQGNITHTSVNGGGVTYHLKHGEATNPFGMLMSFSSASPDNNTNYFLRCEDSTTNRIIIYSDGDVKNHDNSYGSLSDERIKQDIRDSNSQWNDIKNVRVRNFKKKDDVRQYGENAKNQIGVVAQELETISPNLIKLVEPTPSDILSDSSFGTLYQEGDEIPEGKNVGDVKEIHQQVKGVSYSVLYMKAIKALQEAMERIETLETQRADLEARVTALENA